LGALYPGVITSLDFGTISYKCGDVIKLKYFLAWSTASSKDICPLDLSSISPKCGKLPSITVNAGVNGEFALTNSNVGLHPEKLI
jgi:hypothetical protein